MWQLWHRLKRRWSLSRLTNPRYRSLFNDDNWEIVSIDCETTSLKVREAELLSIAAVKLRANRILTSEALYLLVKPQQQPTHDNICVHGLRPVDVKQGLPPEEALYQLLDFIGGRALLGYYLEYDIAVLNRYLKPLIGIGLPNRRIELSGRYYDWQTQEHPNSNVDLRLNTLIDTLKAPALPRHNALNDAITTAMLYQALRWRRFG